MSAKEVQDNVHVSNSNYRNRYQIFSRGGRNGVAVVTIMVENVVEVVETALLLMPKMSNRPKIRKRTLTLPNQVINTV